MSETIRAAGSNAVLRMCQESEWGVTPTSFGDPGDPSVYLIGLKSETLGSTKNNFESDMINAKRCTIGLGDGNKAVEGNIVSDLIPEGLEMLFMHLLGNPNVADGTFETTGSGPFTHVIKGSAGNFKGLTIEKEYSDIGKSFTYTGCRVNTMSIALSQEGFHEVTFGFIGKEEIVGDTGKLSGGIVATKSGYTGYQVQVYTDMQVDGTVDHGNYVALGFVVGGNININNNIETNGYVLGSAFRASAQLGKRACSGDFTTFFTDDKLYQLYANGTVCGIKFVFDNNIGQKLTIEFPEVKLSGKSPEIANFQGLNIALNFNAKYHEGSDTDVIITIENSIETLEAGV